MSSPSQSTNAGRPQASNALPISLPSGAFHDEAVESGDEDLQIGQQLSRSFTRGFRRPSVPGGTHPLHLSVSQADAGNVEPSPKERAKLIKQERNLLRDNKLIPPKKSSKSQPSDGDEHIEPTETTGLLAGSAVQSYQTDGVSKTPTNDDIERQFEEAVLAGLIKTTWRREAKVLARTSAPLILTFILQYSLHMTSIFTVGHIGTDELGAVSVGSMTASITGWSVFQGCVTALDTLCSQAYGAGNKTLVGLHLQRMVWFLFCVLVPIGTLWFNAGYILKFIVPEQRPAELAGVYLRIILCGAPGNILYECGKRYLMCQGIFDPILYVLLVCAPLNAFLNWLLVWQFQWGFIGSPIAVAVTYNLLPLCLLIVCYLTKGKECWGGFSWAAFRNWGPMISLATSGLVMLVAEWLAFEILTLAASYLSGAHLAAQSILSTIAGLTYQLPFAVSVASSTRVANFIGATLSNAANLSARVALCGAFMIGLLNSAILFGLRGIVPKLFTSDETVVTLVMHTMPICVAFQLFDALAASCNGILRGIGRQEIGGYFNLIGYYVLATPLSLVAAFWWKWSLIGLWVGPALTLAILSVAEGIFIFRTSWDQAVEDARKRNAMG